MESRFGPMGLRQEYTYDEVMRAISEQPLKLDTPKRIGLRTFEDIFFNNLINDGMAYQGESHKSGFYHDMPRQPPARPDVYFDADDGEGYNDDGRGPGGGYGGDGQGPSHPFGRLPMNLPIQSGQLLPDFVGPPFSGVQTPDLPNPRHNIIQEEGLQLPPEPPGFFVK